MSTPTGLQCPHLHALPPGDLQTRGLRAFRDVQETPPDPRNPESLARYGDLISYEAEAKQARIDAWEAQKRADNALRDRRHAVEAFERILQQRLGIPFTKPDPLEDEDCHTRTLVFPAPNPAEDGDTVRVTLVALVTPGGQDILTARQSCQECGAPLTSLPITDVVEFATFRQGGHAESHECIAMQDSNEGEQNADASHGMPSHAGTPIRRKPGPKPRRQ
jgi:hypothetical protein